MALITITAAFSPVALKLFTAWFWHLETPTGVRVPRPATG